MNVINKLTLRHMKLNRKRTLVTMFGIIIAVAMITAVSTVGYSIMDYFAREEMITEGYFHLKFANYYYKDNDKIIEEMDAENYSLMKPLGDYFYEWDIEDKNVVIEPYVVDQTTAKSGTAFRIAAVQDNYYEMLSIKLVTGDYPKNDNELLISARDSTFKEKQVGDKLTIGGKEYTICGIIWGDEFEWEELSIPNVMIYPIYTRLDTTTLKEDDIVSSYVYMGGTIDDLEEEAEKLKGELQKTGVPAGELIGEGEKWYCGGVEVLYNYDVLKYLGLSEYSNITFVMDSFRILLVLVIMIGGVSLIANGFAISVSERNKYIGMLASVGATKRQKRNSVYFEGVLEGVIAIPIGIMTGIAGIGITFEIITPILKELSGTDTELILIVNESVILWAIVFSVLTIFLSAYFPARRASKISPIEAIRQNRDVKLTNKMVKTMGITRKIFGFEGELALKNLKRNKKRYRITVFSMFISLTLFISVYSIVYYMKEGVYSEIGDIGYDMTISRDIYSEEDIETRLEYEKEFEQITEKLILNCDEYVEDYNRYMLLDSEGNSFELEMAIEDGMYNQGYVEFLDSCNISVRNKIGIISMNEADLKNYLKSIGVSYDEFVADRDNAILYNSVTTTGVAENERLVYNGTFISDKVERIPYLCTLYEYREFTFDEELLNGEILEHIGYEYIESDRTQGEFHIYDRKEKFMGLSERGGYMLITPEKAQQLKEYGVSVFYKTILEVSNDEKIEEAYNRLIVELGKNSDYFYLHNYTDQIKEVENTMLIISIFVYGFIILMTLICIANIVNTISTSLALRRREFAMLKSVGMTDRKFNRMIAYESVFYGLKAILFGLPVGTAIMLYARYLVENTYSTRFSIPWNCYVIAILGVFAVLGITMLYSSRKIKRANIIEALRDENA